MPHRITRAYKSASLAATGTADVLEPAASRTIYPVVGETLSP
ncbi:hypothetical protein [Natronococcus sp. A-GB7]|nr:hypothetical protein [Natronococcus sp. A-GB7]MDG5817505.1 hypothetical protein [Natronococcus sp. A-GB7]